MVKIEDYQRKRRILAWSRRQLLGLRDAMLNQEPAPRCPVGDVRTGGWSRLVRAGAAVEWPTLLLILACHAGWAGVLFAHEVIGLWPALAVAMVLTALHSSLQHETVHGHPTRSSLVNGLLVLPALGLFVPYGRFRDAHIHHHRTAALTDPYDDPESAYMTLAQWRRRSRAVRLLLRANTTLLGRLTVGPAIALCRLYAGDLARIAAGDREVIRAWTLHILALAPVVVWVWAVCGIDLLLYLAAVAYPAYGLLMMRTFAEHQAHPETGMRTAIVEDRGPLAWLFLFNNLHVVHHMRPDLPWYRLSRAYWRNRSLWTVANGGYVYSSYWALIARHLLRAKEPVVHPAASSADA